MATGDVPAIGILVSPAGEEWYDAYGPLTKDRSKATVFVSAVIAAVAAQDRLGLTNRAFWNSERAAAQSARERYRGWTYRTETT